MAILPAGTPTPAMDPTSGTTQAGQTYYDAITKGDTSQTGATNQGQLNAYTPGQQSLQGMLPGMLAGVLSGQQIPSWMTAPPAAFKAYNDAFNSYVEPNIAAQFGAGSPQIGRQQTMGNEQLAANLYQNGITNYMGYLGNAENFAMTPIGSNTANRFNQDWQNNSEVQGYQGDNMLGSILNKLVAGLNI